MSSKIVDLSGLFFRCGDGCIRSEAAIKKIKFAGRDFFAFMDVRDKIFRGCYR